MGSCSVLVIGGSGFLGQHVISLLQSRAPFVTEIRTLDIVPYENKLDHGERVPVQVFTGTVTDVDLVEEACRGVNFVIHLATVIDHSMFPDVAKMTKVNVEGPSVVLKVVADTPSVYGYIFSSSIVIHFGKGISGTDLTEESPIPEERYFEPYATSKLQAEKLVLQANGPSLRTVIIRPSIMYGDLDYNSQTQMNVATAFNGWMFEMKANKARHQQTYVGNVAWGFVCAVDKLNKQRTSQQNGDTGSAIQRDISGEAFLIADETEPVNMFAKERFYLEAAGIRYFPWKFPMFILVMLMHVIYAVLKPLSMLGVRLNFRFSVTCMSFFNVEYIFSDKKARELLGYKPLFDVEVAKQRTIEYHQKLWTKTKGKSLI